MQSDPLSFILWEDVSEIHSRLEKVLAALQTLEHAIEEGQISQPTRQDSKQLNRLVVLADLLYAEIRPWVNDQIDLPLPGKNGHRAPTAAMP